MTGVAIPEIERGTRRNIEQLRVFLLTFDTGVRPGQRILEIVRNVLVELLVLLVRNSDLARTQSAFA